MAYKMEIEGIEELNSLLEKLGSKAESVAAASLYDGAGVLADGIKKAAQDIEAEPQHGKQKRQPTPEEKAAVIQAIGIAKFRKDGNSVETVVGVTNKSGYAKIGKKEKPVAMIASAVNSGTSFMKKQPFVRIGKNKSQGAASAAIVSKAEDMFDKIINNK